MVRRWQGDRCFGGQGPPVELIGPPQEDRSPLVPTTTAQPDLTPEERQSVLRTLKTPRLLKTEVLGGRWWRWP